jgi:hypothetical protein
LIEIQAKNVFFRDFPNREEERDKPWQSVMAVSRELLWSWAVG